MPIKSYEENPWWGWLDPLLVNDINNIINNSINYWANSSSLKLSGSLLVKIYLNLKKDITGPSDELRTLL